jgi:outer membrane protein OmpA-like peptidoglycan-associated protein
MIHNYRVAFSVCVASLLTLGLLAPTFAQDVVDELPEHPVIKPMNGATLIEDTSRADDFGQMLVRYRLDGKTIDETAEGKFWHLEYQLENRDTSRDEIMANYAAEAERVGGEVLDRRGTRLRLRIVNRGGGTTWAILDARTNGAYELEILDEAGLDLSLEFDSAAMFDALTRDGKVAIYGILFDVNLADLRPGSGEVIDTVAEVLKVNPGLRVEVQGHTDSTGAAERNRQLSLDRAQSVAAALALYGVEPSRLVPRGFGPDQPVADNADEQGRQQNRRVELVRIP